MAKDVQIAVLGLLLAASMPIHAESDADAFRAFVMGIPPLSVRNPSTDPDGDVIVPSSGTGYSGAYGDRMATSEETRRLTRTLEAVVAFDPNAGVLFPGALVQGKTLPDGVLAPIVTTRREQTCTVTGLTGPGGLEYSSTFVPTNATATAAVAKILSQNFSADQPARMTYTMTSFSSLEEGVLKLGASYKWLSGSVSGSFSTTNLKANTRFLVRFVQTYYTVSCQPPGDPIGLFDPKTDYKELRNYVSAENPPVFINSVTYGRELWMLIESTHTEDEIKAALNAAVNFGAGSGSADFNKGDKQTISDSAVQVLVLGGGGKPAISVVTGDASKITAFIKAGADFSALSPGWAISYTAMYLRDNTLARISSTSDYTIKTSVASPIPAPVSAVRAIWRTTGDGKDFNTQPVVDVTDKSGRAVAHVDCCSVDRNGDKWSSGQTTSAKMKIFNAFTTDDLQHGAIAARRIPHGKDDWDYNLTVDFTFADGSQVQKSCSGRNSCGVVW